MRKHSDAVLAWKPSGRYTTAYLMRPVAEMVANVDAVMLDGDLLERTADIILGNGSKEAAAHATLRKQLAEVDDRLDNLAEALANGFQSDLVRQKFTEAENQKVALEEKIRAIAPSDPIDREILLEELCKDADRLRIDIDDETITVQAMCDLGEGSTAERIEKRRSH